MANKEQKNDDKYTIIEGAIEPPKPIPPRDEDKDQAISNRDFVDWVKKK
jgi:hypothetical protein